MVLLFLVREWSRGWSGVEWRGAGEGLGEGYWVRVIGWIAAAGGPIAATSTDCRLNPAATFHHAARVQPCRTVPWGTSWR